MIRLASFVLASALIGGCTPRSSHTGQPAPPDALASTQSTTEPGAQSGQAAAEQAPQPLTSTTLGTDNGTAPAATVATAASSATKEALVVQAHYFWKEHINPEETLYARVPTPPGFERVFVEQGSFGAWLRTLPVKPGRPRVMLYDGDEKGNQSAHALVLDIDTGARDLQQCADAVMRLRAEYLYSEQRFSDVHFNFTTGDRASYTKWAQGFRPQVHNNKVSWAVTAASDTSYAGFRKYLDSVFTYAGTASLSRELKAQELSKLKPGDVFIVGGFPGHAVIVADVAKNNATDETVFLLVQSYMPAQDMHLLRNPKDRGLSPWYSTDFGNTLHTPEWDFSVDQLKQFPADAVPATPVSTASTPQSATSAPAALRCLNQHYGGTAQRSGDDWVLAFGKQQHFVFDDGMRKSQDELLDEPDLQDTLAAPYQTVSIINEKRTADPGRARHLGLLRAVYGANEEQVQASLVSVRLGGQHTSVHKKVAPALERVSAALDELAQTDPTVREYLKELGGGFKWRTIEGTTRLSAHSFGIAVDLNPRKSAYYRWNSAWDGTFHQGIVDAFEAEGFIWGGRWKHFDSMHFEYRPELLDAKCRTPH